MSQPRIEPDHALRRSIVNAAYRSAQPILLNLISLPAMALIIRKLGTTGYGQWTTATTLVTTLGFMTCLGLRGPFIRSIALDRSSGAAALAEQLGARMVLTAVVFFAILIACLCLGYSPTVLQCA